MLLSHLTGNPDPFCVLRSLKNKGVNCNEFNSQVGTGTFLCNVIRKNFGMGIKILIDCGFDMTLKDSSTGDSPLMLVTAEGLCGPTQVLLDHLPAHSLQDVNHSEATALKHLLARAHGSCGCIEKLLTRIPVGPQLISYPIDNGDCEFPIEHIRSTNQNSHKVLLMNLADLLIRIRSNDVKRILSVLRIWIRANLLLLEGLSKATRLKNSEVFVEKVLRPVLGKHGKQEQQSEECVVHETIRMMCHLFVLDQLDQESLKQYCAESISATLANEMQNQGPNTIEYHLRCPPTQTLCDLTLLRIRQHLQRRFVRECTNAVDPTGSSVNATVFEHWVTQLGVPSIFKNLILLEP